MAAISRLPRSVLPSCLAAATYRSTRAVGGAAQATIDVEFFNVPLGNVVDVLGNDQGRGPQWVFLGCPGVGKGTYASRLAKLLDVPHIAMGDLVRLELKRSSAVSKQLSDAMMKGKLLPDEVIFTLLTKRLEQGRGGDRGFILDGFPRTLSQAEVLEDITDVDLVVNLKLREDVLISKCLGRRICSQCGGNFNLAKIDVAGTDGGEPRIFMPPLLPPPSCAQKMTVRPDDTDEVVRARLRVYYEESAPVEDFYRSKDKLLDFNVGGGIPETWPHLLAALNIIDKKPSEAQGQKLVA